MTQDPIVAALMRDVMAPLLFAIASAAAAWVVARLPGPIRDVMASATHARDVALLNGALQRRAVVEVANQATPPPSPDDLIRYVETVLPGLLAKMAIAPAGLETIAQAAIVKAEAEVVPPALAIPDIR